MRIPHLPRLAASHRTFTLFALLGPALCAQSVFDVSDLDSANISVAERWIVLSGAGTTPTTNDSITVIGTNGVTTSAQIAMSTDRTIANFVYGTASSATDITRDILVRGSGTDTTRSLTLGGNLTKYDTGTLSFRNHNTSILRLQIGGDVTVHEGVLNFGTSSSNGLGFLGIAGTTSILGGTLNLRIGADAALGALEMTGGTLNLNTNDAVNAASGRTIEVRSLGGSGGSIGETSTGTGTTLTLAVTGSATRAYAGSITDGSGTATIAFKMSGSGLQTLSSANTYAGGTTVESGSLLVNNTTGSGVGTGAVVVKNGATFGGDGIVALGAANGVTVESGGVLAAGGGDLALRFDGNGTSGVLLKMNTGSSFSLDLGGAAASLVDFWNYAGASDLSLGGVAANFTGAQAEGVYTLFRFYSDNGTTLAESGIVSGLVLGSGLEQFETAFLTYGPNSVTLTLAGMTIPEPGAAAALSGLVILGVASVRRRHRS